MTKRVSESDILTSLSALASSELYTPKDRYHDFRKIFMGSDEGKRALREIVSWGRLLNEPKLPNPIDPYRLAIREGERNIVRRLIATVYIEPPERPTKSQRSE